jgi:hypothetical protein
MNEIAVHFAPNEIEAESAAGALRANRLHPRVVRDDTFPSRGIASSVGWFVVYVPGSEARSAREILRPPRRS